MNVVTIDFDIIMAPDIELYNNWIEADIGIDEYIKKYKILENLKADLYIYEYLTRYIMKVINKINSDNIFFIESHETITKHLNSENINLWNIDHHHDILYDENKTLATITTCDCGNWVKYLIDNKKVHNYTWICNENSDPPSEYINNHYHYDTKILREFNLEKLADETDMLFICKSPEWIPEYYLPLYDTWIAICEEYYNESFKVLFN